MLKPEKSFNCNADRKKKNTITNEVVSAGYNSFNSAQQQTETDAFQPEAFFSVTLVACQTRPRARARPKCYILNCKRQQLHFLFCDYCFTQRPSFFLWVGGGDMVVVYCSWRTSSFQHQRQCSGQVMKIAACGKKKSSG